MPGQPFFPQARIADVSPNTVQLTNVCRLSRPYGLRTEVRAPKHDRHDGRQPGQEPRYAKLRSELPRSARQSEQTGGVLNCCALSGRGRPFKLGKPRYRDPLVVKRMGVSKIQHDNPIQDRVDHCVAVNAEQTRRISNPYGKIDI